MAAAAAAILLLRRAGALRPSPPHRCAFFSLSSLFQHETSESVAKEPSDLRRWKERKAEIHRDISPIFELAKSILHSDRYEDGELLSPPCEKEVVEKILKHHPRLIDKIGCKLGAVSIMVDRHPEFKESRCLFAVTPDGHKVDFSYRKCLKAYVLCTYPEDAERFLKEHSI